MNQTIEQTFLKNLSTQHIVWIHLIAWGKVLEVINRNNKQKGSILLTSGKFSACPWEKKIIQLVCLGDKTKGAVKHKFRNLFVLILCALVFCLQVYVCVRVSDHYFKMRIMSSQKKAKCFLHKGQGNDLRNSSHLKGCPSHRMPSTRAMGIWLPLPRCPRTAWIALVPKQRFSAEVVLSWWALLGKGSIEPWVNGYLRTIEQEYTAIVWPQHLTSMQESEVNIH